jgi:hypothetical protein
LAPIATLLFFRECRAFFKNVWHFKDIFREFEAFVKILTLFEDIFKKIEALYNVRDFEILRGFLNTFLA